MVKAPCFVRGTHVRTPEGEVRVEDLAIGQPISTLSGAAQPVNWVGRRAYDPRFLAANLEALPILIRQGALGDGTPRRDLYVSEHHALLLDGWLVEAGLVENGRSIQRLRRWSGPLEYFHIELERHDVIFAEGATAETYLDCGNREAFQNADSFRRLHPAFQITDQQEWAGRLVRGPALDAIRARLVQRAIVSVPDVGLAS